MKSIVRLIVVLSLGLGLLWGEYKQDQHCQIYTSLFEALNIYDFYCKLPIDDLSDVVIFNEIFFKDEQFNSHHNDTYDQIYKEYTTIVKGQVIYKNHTRFMAFITGKMFAHCTKVNNLKKINVLEIGSGVGDTTALIYQGFKSVSPHRELKLKGIDICESMCNIARLCNDNDDITFENMDISVMSISKKYDFICGFFAPFNYAKTLVDLQNMLAIIVHNLSSSGIAVFLFNSINKKTASKFFKIEDSFILKDVRGVEFKTYFHPELFIDELCNPCVIEVTIFNNEKSITFANYVWSESCINNILNALGCRNIWLDCFNECELQDYEKTKFNKLLIITK